MLFVFVPSLGYLPRHRLFRGRYLTRRATKGETYLNQLMRFTAICIISDFE